MGAGVIAYTAHLAARPWLLPYWIVRKQASETAPSVRFAYKQ
jgi:hypothetical protein